MKCRPRKFPLIRLLLIYFILLLHEETLYSENIQYAYKFCEADLYVNVQRCI